MALSACLSIAILTGTKSVKVETQSGIDVVTQWQCGSSPSWPGSLTLFTQSKGNQRSINLAMDSDAWLPQDIVEKPAVLLTPILGTDHVILDVTMAIESGVYGYRRMKSFRINPMQSGLVEPIGEEIEFSDFGSWRRIDPKTIEFWEADWSEEIAHQAPHRYMLTRLNLSGTKNAVVSRQTTKKRYRVDADSYWHSGQIEIEPSQDPLREMGSSWTWWGS